MLNYLFGIVITTLSSYPDAKKKKKRIYVLYFLHLKKINLKKRKEIATTRASVGTNSEGTCSLPQPESIFLAPLYSIRQNHSEMDGRPGAKYLPLL